MRLLGVTRLSQLGPHLVSSLGGAILKGATDMDVAQLNTKAIDPLLADKPMYSPEEQAQGRR